MRRAALAAAALLVLAACRRAPSASVRELDAILAAHDDNDPRLDSDFNALTESDKTSLRIKYRETPPEHRNERGTIVYILGKNLKDSADWAFLRDVASEPPCLSLADCRRSAATQEPGDDVTLAYPSLVALKQAQRALETKDSPEARAVVAAGKHSKMPAVTRLAARIEAKPPKK